ncbi:MAG: NAD-dependent epimerase/dehydratase family protein [Bacteroidales bacterium]|nr:NAD-dependent epimerase/dehydratase family protein [Bacteroidales bacterium]MCF8458449.1 NAD-dependent epimerase/dehydratase family protein [Bacteroidales bacterium]
MIFITGGTGLVGSHLILELAMAGKHIVALKRPGSKISVLNSLCSWYQINPEKLLENISWVDGDLLDPVSIEDALEDVDEVYHCAALVSFNPKDRAAIIQANVEGTANLVNACLEKDIEKFCHVSSIAVFGQSVDGQAVDEESPRTSESGHSAYSTSKYYSELEVWRGMTEGLNGVIVNPSIILGPGIDWTKGSLRMFNEVSKGMKFYTTGGSGFVDVRDVVSVMVKLMDKEIFNQRFCLNSENLSYREVFSEIALTLNLKAPSIEAKPWMLQLTRHFESIKSKISQSEPRVTKESARSAFNRTIYSNQKIVELLGHEFIPVRDSIRQTGELFLFSKKTR